MSPIFAEQPAEIVIANRTIAKAKELANEFSDLGKITGVGYEQLMHRSEPFDLVINGTSLSLTGDLPSVPEMLLTSETCVYDMVYANEPTPFMSWAKGFGCQVSDGLGMLVGQAAESFYIWCGVRPPTLELIKILREEV